MTAQREFPRILAIGGSDPSGGAGVQADIKTGAAFGVDVSTVITAITAQNSTGVQSVTPVPEAMVAAQLASVCEDIPPHAVKLGMLFDRARVEAVKDAILKYKLRPIVCDPVLASSSGRALLDPEGIVALKSLFPYVTLLTPNAIEAALLSGKTVEDESSLLDAGRSLLGSGVQAVLLKGGHMTGSDSADILLVRNHPRPTWFSATRIATRNNHGTGCALASAIASCLALGNALPDAVSSARNFVQQALHAAAHVSNGSGQGGMNLLHNPAALRDRPLAT